MLLSVKLDLQQKVADVIEQVARMIEGRTSQTTDLLGKKVDSIQQD